MCINSGIKPMDKFVVVFGLNFQFQSKNQELGIIVTASVILIKYILMKGKIKTITRQQRSVSTREEKEVEIDLQKPKSHNNSFEHYSGQLPQLDKPSKQSGVKVINLLNGSNQKGLEMYKERAKRNKKTKLNLNISLQENQKFDVKPQLDKEIDLKIKQTNQNKFQLKLWLSEDGAFAPTYLPNRLKQAEARSLTPIKAQQTLQPSGTPEPRSEMDRFRQLEPLQQTIQKSKVLKPNGPTKNEGNGNDNLITDDNESKQEKNVEDIKLNVESFLAVEIAIIDMLKHTKVVQTLCMTQHNHQELVGAINNYMEIIVKGDFDSLEGLFMEEKYKKIIRQAILMERVGIIVLVNGFFEGHFFLQNAANFRNILLYSQQNYYLLCEIIVERIRKFSSEEDPLAIKSIQSLQAILTKYNKERSVKRQDVWNQLKQNAEMISNLNKQLTKNSRDLYQFLLNYMRICNQATVKQSFRSLLEFTSLYFTIQQSYQGMLGITLLTVAPEPYLPAIQNRQYTLVLDMDETLVHFSETPQGGQFQVRPYAIQFLNEMFEYYELVVFTAGLPDYANWVLNSIDPNGLIKYRLFRNHAIHQKNIFIKDLSRLGRNLNKCIIVDNVAENFQNQPDNGIFIKPWYSDPSDTALAELAPLLRQIVQKQYDDVKVALKNFKEQMKQNISQGQPTPHLNLSLA